MEPRVFRKAVEADIRQHELIPPGGEVTCLVSGGADSTCLWHVLRELGYRVSAVHVDHGLRGARVGRGRALLPRGARRRGRRRPRRARPRTSCARSATRSRPTGCARRATRPPTRSRPSSTGSSPAARRAGSPWRRADGVVRPAAQPLARRDRGVLPRRGARLPPRLVEPGHEAGPDPRADPAAAAPAPPGRGRQSPPAGRPQDRPAGARPPPRVRRRLGAARPRQRPGRRARVRPGLARALAGRARRRGALGRLAHRVRRAGP